MSLLRSSRRASFMTKEAFISGIARGVAGGLGALTRGTLGVAGKATTGVLGGAGKLIRKYPKVSIPVLAGGTAAAMEIPQAIRRSRFALSPPGLAARRASGYRLAKTPKEVAGAHGIVWNPKPARSGMLGYGPP